MNMTMRGWGVARRLARGGAALLTTGILACSGQAEGTPESYAQGLRHPTADNLPDDSDLAAVVGREAVSEDPGLRGWVRVLTGAELVDSLGALDGQEADMFGMVEGVVANGDSTFWVLDSRLQRVRLYHRNGTLLSGFGRPGHGPNEFMAPEAIERDQGGRLIVADRFNRLKIFAFEDGEYVNLRTVPVRYAPEDFCLLEEKIYVQGISAQGATIHVYGSDGDSVASFAEAYRSPNWLVRNQLSDGPIGCSEEGRTVVQMFRYLPLVYGYGPDGELRWVTRIADFSPIGIVEDIDQRGRPTVEMTPPPDGFEVAHSITSIPGGYVLIQIAHHTRESLTNQEEYESLHSYVLSASTGAGAYVGTNLPTVSAVSDGVLYATRESPYPQVRIYQLPREDESWMES